MILKVKRILVFASTNNHKLNFLSLNLTQVVTANKQIVYIQDYFKCLILNLSN